MSNRPFWSGPLLLAVCAPPVQATAVEFNFLGQCVQNCAVAALLPQQQVTGRLVVDSALMPTLEGQDVMVSNASLLDLSVTYGAQSFGFADVVSTDQTQFMLLHGQLIVRNGNGLLARNGQYGLLVSGPGGGLLPPVSGLWLQEPSVLSYGRFVAGPDAAPVPEPAPAALLLLGLAAVVWLRRSASASAPRGA